MTQSFEDCDWLVVQEGKKEQSQVYGLLTYTEYTVRHRIVPLFPITLIAVYLSGGFNVAQEGQESPTRQRNCGYF